MDGCLAGRRDGPAATEAGAPRSRQNFSLLCTGVRMCWRRDGEKRPVTLPAGLHPPGSSSPSPTGCSATNGIGAVARREGASFCPVRFVSGLPPLPPSNSSPRFVVRNSSCQRVRYPRVSSRCLLPRPQRDTFWQLLHQRALITVVSLTVVVVLAERSEGVRSRWSVSCVLQQRASETVVL